MLFTDSYNQIKLGKLGFIRSLVVSLLHTPFLVYNKKDIDDDKISYVKKKKDLLITIVILVY